jgi:hypothetical protein
MTVGAGSSSCRLLADLLSDHEKLGPSGKPSCTMTPHVAQVKIRVWTHMHSANAVQSREAESKCHVWMKEVSAWHCAKI